MRLDEGIGRCFRITRQAEVQPFKPLCLPVHGRGFLAKQVQTERRQRTFGQWPLQSSATESCAIWHFDHACPGHPDPDGGHAKEATPASDDRMAAIRRTGSQCRVQQSRLEPGRPRAARQRFGRRWSARSNAKGHTFKPTTRAGGYALLDGESLGSWSHDWAASLARAAYCHRLLSAHRFSRRVRGGVHWFCGGSRRGRCRENHSHNRRLFADHSGYLACCCNCRSERAHQRHRSTCRRLLAATYPKPGYRRTRCAGAVVVVVVVILLVERPDAVSCRCGRCQGAMQ